MITKHHKTCSDCGYIVEDIPMNDSVFACPKYSIFVCPKCGLEIDFQLNSLINRNKTFKKQFCREYSGTELRIDFFNRKGYFNPIYSGLDFLELDEYIETYFESDFKKYPNLRTYLYNRYIELKDELIEKLRTMSLYDRFNELHRFFDSRYFLLGPGLTHEEIFGKYSKFIDNSVLMRYGYISQKY